MDTTVIIIRKTKEANMVYNQPKEIKAVIDILVNELYQNKIIDDIQRKQIDERTSGAQLIENTALDISLILRKASKEAKYEVYTND